MQAFLVCGLILFVSPFASSLKCQACGPGENPCDDANVKSVDCEPLADRCMTVYMTMTIPNVGLQTQVMKNCSHSTMICQEQGQYYACKSAASIPGASCNVTCCQGDLCNQASSAGPDPATVAPTPSATVTAETTKPDNTSLPSNDTSAGVTEPPSAGVPKFTATFGAILLSMVLAILAALG